MMMTKKYRIHWKFKTGRTGHGYGTYAKDQADQIARILSKEHNGRVRYWAVAEPPSPVAGYMG